MKKPPNPAKAGSRVGPLFFGSPKPKMMKAALGIIGIGNDIVGDDGAGIMVVRRLKKSFSECLNCLVYELTGDLLEMAELVNRAEKFIFIDAVAGSAPGTITIMRTVDVRSFSASFHQTDIAAVMHSLEALTLASPFPQWELWGIEIEPPTHFRRGLTKSVSLAVNTCVARLTALLPSITARS